MPHRGRKFRWSPEEDRILRENYGKTLIANFSDLLPGRFELGIMSRAKRLGLYSPLVKTPRKRRVFVPEPPQVRKPWIPSFNTTPCSERELS